MTLVQTMDFTIAPIDPDILNRIKAMKRQMNQTEFSFSKWQEDSNLTQMDTEYEKLLDQLEKIGKSLREFKNHLNHSIHSSSNYATKEELYSDLETVICNQELVKLMSKIIQENKKNKSKFNEFYPTEKVEKSLEDLNQNFNPEEQKQRVLELISANHAKVNKEFAEQLKLIVAKWSKYQEMLQKTLNLALKDANEKRKMFPYETLKKFVFRISEAKMEKEMIQSWLLAGYNSADVIWFSAFLVVGLIVINLFWA